MATGLHIYEVVGSMLERSLGPSNLTPTFIWDFLVPFIIPTALVQITNLVYTVFLTSTSPLQ